jgi:hypothetical protein
MVMFQAINYQDAVNRKTVCEFLLNAPDNDELNQVLVTDEANFSLCGKVNSQNCGYRTTENPRGTYQKTLHSVNIIVWCCVTSFVVIGPCLFDDEADMAVTVNSARHSEMLRIFLELVLQRLGSETQTLCFQRN